MPQNLLKRFVQAYPAQPATAFWRAFEIQALASIGLPSGRGLDLGCGDGKLTSILLSLTGERSLVGVDLDPLETEAAARFPFYQAVHTAPGDAIPEPDASFDFVISNSVLEHIPNLEPVIAEVGRLLKPGGQFFFTVPAPDFKRNLAGSLIPFSSRQDYLERLDRRLAHFNYLSADDWRAMCGRHDLSVEGCAGYLGLAETRRWETLSRMTGGLLYALGGGSLRPIEIQRRLGLRQAQNSAGLPGPIASMVTAIVGAGFPPESIDDPWRSDSPSCLLVSGRRTGAE